MKKSAQPAGSSNTRYTPLIVWVLVCETVGIIGALFTVQAIPTWYATLIKPSFAPPNYLFGPVWTLLYAVMGVAVYRIWRLGWGNRRIRRAVTLFAVHLAVNAAWSIIFFGMHSVTGGLVTIAVLWALIAAVIVEFKTLDRISAIILVPYLLWVSFAAYLNYSIWLLNH